MSGVFVTFAHNPRQIEIEIEEQTETSEKERECEKESARERESLRKKGVSFFLIIYYLEWCSNCVCPVRKCVC